MIACTLRDKKYIIDFVSGRALRGNLHCSFAVNFRCKPFFYLSGAETILLTTSSGAFLNPGSIASEPVITAYGSGDIKLMIASQLIELKGIEDSLTLDSVLREAYSGTTSMNGCMDGEFPRLPPGAVPYSWEGAVNRIEIQPNWRSL